MRIFGVVCFSLLLSTIPATASDQNLKEEFGKLTTAYEQHFNKKDAAGITSLFTKDYLRVTSRPEGFHLRALPEPYVNLSIHTAPDVRPLPWHSGQ
jgi:hypothetical protein